jgi:hypothetical protein
LLEILEIKKVRFKNLNFENVTDLLTSEVEVEVEVEVEICYLVTLLIVLFLNMKKK